MKKIKKYITVPEGTDFRTIAKKMSVHGHKMNHATARNLMLSAMETFIKTLGSELGAEMYQEKLINLMKNQEFHNTLSEVLYLIGKEYQKD